MKEKINNMSNFKLAQVIIGVICLLGLIGNDSLFSKCIHGAVLIVCVIAYFSEKDD